MFRFFVFTIVLDILRALMKIYFMYCGSSAYTFIICKALFGFAFVFFEDVAQIILLGKVMFIRDEVDGQEQFSMAVSIFSIVITFLGICMNICKYCGGKTDEAEDELW